MHNYPDYEVERLDNFKELFNRINSFADRVAFVDNGIEYTYGQFCTDVEKAMSIFSIGNTHVLLNISNKYLFSVAYFATVLSGNIACLQPASAKKLFCFAKLSFSIELDDNTIKNLLNSHSSVKAIYRENDYISTVLCSSGTTALPKAVALSQRNIIADLISGMEKYQFSVGGTYINVIPFTHAFGLVCDLLAPLYSASTIYLTNNVVEFFAAIVKANPTALNITPGLAEVLAQRIKAIGDKKKVVGSRLYKILSGGAGTSSSLCEKLAEYGIIVCGCYGLSECAPCVCVNRDEYNKFGSAGIPLNCNTVHIEQSGEIKIVGENVMLGYLDEYGKIENELRGEYTTGDIGYIDDDGFLYVQGRVDDVIVFPDGNKLMPQVIEAELNKINGITESIVYLSDNKLATQIVIANPNSSTEIENYVRRNTFNGYKLVKIKITTESLKRNATGKVNRREYGR